MVIFGSREQLCVHEEVSLLRGKVQNNTCHLICRKREKYQCSHYSRVEGKLYIAHFYDYAGIHLRLFTLATYLQNA